MKRSSDARRPFPRAAFLLLTAGMVACGSGAVEAPTPQTSTTLPPMLRGRTVMVLPMQAQVGAGGEVDAELAFALSAVGGGVTWVFPPRLERAIQGAPGLGARMTGLPVGIFMQAEVERVGDPLYGDLLRLSALVDAEVALVPIQVAPGAPDVDGRAALETTVALIAVRSGAVLWFGVVEGDPGEPGSPGVLASAMESLARRLLWYQPA